MRQRAPIPVERRIDIRARAHVIEPTRGTVRQKHIQPVGVAVAATGCAVVQGDIDALVGATKNGQSLRVEEHRA